MQPSFFDYAMEYQGGKKSMKILSEMKELIPFDTIEVKLIEEGIYKPIAFIFAMIGLGFLFGDDDCDI